MKRPAGSRCFIPQQRMLWNMGSGKKGKGVKTIPKEEFMEVLEKELKDRIEIYRRIAKL